jgi:hypothetical protein
LSEEDAEKLRAGREENCEAFFWVDNGHPFDPNVRHPFFSSEGQCFAVTAIVPDGKNFGFKLSLRGGLDGQDR